MANRLVIGAATKFPLPHRQNVPCVAKLFSSKTHRLAVTYSLTMSDIETIRRKNGFIIDMDGVVYHGNRCCRAPWSSWLFTGTTEEIPVSSPTAAKAPRWSCTRSGAVGRQRGCRIISTPARSPPRRSCKPAPRGQRVCDRRGWPDECTLRRRIRAERRESRLRHSR